MLEAERKTLKAKRAFSVLHYAFSVKRCAFRI